MNIISHYNETSSLDGHIYGTREGKVWIISAGSLHISVTGRFR